MKAEKSNIVQRWIAIILVGVFTFLAIIQALPMGIEDAGIVVEATDDDPVEEVEEVEEVERPASNGGKYERSELTSVLPSAYFETKNSVTGDGESAGKKGEIFKENIQAVSGRHYGNVGLFVGFPGDSDSQMAALNTSNAISINEANNHFNNNDIKKYYSFGAAVQDLSKKGIQSDKIEESSQRTINGLTSAAKNMSKAGARILSRYNPAPILLALYKTPNGANGVDLSSYPDNKLVEIVVNNPSLKAMLDLIRTSPSGSTSANYTLFTWIVVMMVIMLVIAGVVIQVMNGRSSGESYRKAMVKIAVSALGVPVMATLLNFGVTTFVEVTDPDITPAEEYAEQAIGLHLNFADWYATGFAVPGGGTSLVIKDDKFVFNSETVRRINNYTYNVLNGVSSPESSTPDVNKVYARLLSAGDQNIATPSFVEKDGWDGMSVKKAGDAIVKNAEATAEEEKGWLGSLLEGSKGSYMYGFRNVMNGSAGDYTVSVADAEGNAKESNVYGMSPLASYNLMRSSFSGGNISSSLAKPKMASVVYSAAGPGSNPDDKEMNSLTKLLATFVMVVAAMKGLAKIFASGLGGIFSGAAGGGLGSSSGLGQGIGGIIALLAGVLGMGLIMNLSFIFLDELNRIIFDIFQGTVAGDANMLDPLRDIVDSLPGVLKIFKVPLHGALNNLSTLVITIMSMIVLPKFGKIPINLFSEKMCEIPGSFAEKAQMLENRFTGDYRAGGGGGGRGGAMNSFNSQASQAGADGMSQAKGLGTAAAAVGGMGMGLAGGGLTALGDKIMGGTDEGDHTEGIQSMNNSSEEDSNVDGNAIDGNEVDGDSIEGNEDSSMITDEDVNEGSMTSTEALSEGDILGNDILEGQSISSVNDISGANLSSTDNLEGESISSVNDISGANLSSTDNLEGESISSANNLEGESISSVDNLGGEDVYMSGEQTSMFQAGGLDQDFDGNDESVNSSNASLNESSNVNANSESNVNTNATMTSNTSSPKVDSGLGSGPSVNARGGNTQGETQGKSINQTQPTGAGNTGLGSVAGTGSPGSQQSSINAQNPGVRNQNIKEKLFQVRLMRQVDNKPKASSQSVTPQIDSNLKTGRPTLNKNASQGSKSSSTSTPPKTSGARSKTGKVIKSVGNLMQSAGGPVTADRVISTAKHAATSAVVGGHAQQKSQARLDRAQGDVSVPISGGQPSPNRTASQERRDGSTRGKISRREQENFNQDMDNLNKSTDK